MCNACASFCILCCCKLRALCAKTLAQIVAHITRSFSISRNIRTTATCRRFSDRTGRSRGAWGAIGRNFRQSDIPGGFHAFQYFHCGFSLDRELGETRRGETVSDFFGIRKRDCAGYIHTFFYGHTRNDARTHRRNAPSGISYCRSRT